MGKEVAPNSLIERRRSPFLNNPVARGLLVLAALGASTADIKYPDINPRESAPIVSRSEDTNFNSRQINAESGLPTGYKPW